MKKSITFRVSEADRQKIFKDSAALNKTASDFIRLMVFNCSEHFLQQQSRIVALENELRNFKEINSKSNN